MAFATLKAHTPQVSLSRRNVPEPDRTRKRAGLTVLLAGGVMTAALALLGRPAFDQALLDAGQRGTVPGDEPFSRALYWFAGSGAFLLPCTATMVGWIRARRWSWIAAASAIPLGLISGILMSEILPPRSRPHVSLGPVDSNLIPPGAALIALTVFVGMAGVLHLPRQWPKWVAAAARLLVGMAITLPGLAYLRVGVIWPSELISAYALSFGLMQIAFVIHRRLTVAVDGVPLIHAGFVPHDESSPHAHALTSIILFKGDRVAKIYSPGLLPRALYWLAFQAPFAYEVNETALRACLHRRNLAGHLTRYWYGSNRVASALAVERVDGRLALISTLIDGCEPKDHDAARAFLSDLCDRFDEVGLPTWQIDPRQPRSLGNVLEEADGTFTIIDLESGLVSPLASPRAWWRAIRRALVPFYDDVYFDLTRAYIRREEANLRSSCGDAWYAELIDLLERAEVETWAWHLSEPRVWSRLARAVQPELGRPPAVRCPDNQRAE